ncbi:MAG: FlgD immunoglobulin-like domain containing protein [Candidatus Poribacteria bacterium]
MKKIYAISLIVFILLTGLVSAWALGALDLFPPPWPDAPLASQGPVPKNAIALTDSMSAESCAKCHAKQYNEWKGSMHNNSFVDPVHQAFLKANGMEFCSACHLPTTEQTPALVSFGPNGPVVAPNPEFKQELMSEGVTCAVCHMRQWVRHGPPQEGKTEADLSKIHEVKFSEDYEKSEFCARCHQEELEHIPGTPLAVIPPGTKVLWDNTYGEWQQWQASLPKGHEDKDKQCQDCHMPKEQHLWKGGHSPDMVKAAVKVNVVTDKKAYGPGDKVTAKIDITNARAGHKFPSGGSGGNFRMVTVTANVIDEGGKVIQTQQFPPIMRAMKDTFIEVSDNRIVRGETRLFNYSFTVPKDVKGQVYLNTQVAYFLIPPPMFTAIGAPELIEKYPPTIIFDEKKPLLQEKDYTNVFFTNLEQGLNMISLPLEPETPYTARSLAKELDATVVIKFDTKQNRFVGFSVNSPGDSFPIEGGQGYIINVKERKAVTFTGATWFSQPSLAAPAAEQYKSAWAFVLNGTLYNEKGRTIDDRYIVSAKNLRTGAVVSGTVKNSTSGLNFSAVWADLNRKSVIQALDTIEITVTDAEGNQVSEPVKRIISSSDIQNAFTDVSVKVNRIPPGNQLAQNYPNPFNPETWIPFKLAQDADVAIKIFDASGKLVRSIDLGRKSAGYYTSKSAAAYWNGKNNAGESVTSGIYFYSIKAGDFTAMKKLLILK